MHAVYIPPSSIHVWQAGGSDQSPETASYKAIDQTQFGMCEEGATVLVLSHATGTRVPQNRVQTCWYVGVVSTEDLCISSSGVGRVELDDSFYSNEFMNF